MPKPDFLSNFKNFFHIIWAPYYRFSKKNLILKHIFYFLESVKGGPLTKIIATPANFNRPLYQSQNFIRSLNIFPYYLSYLLLIQHKNFNFKAHFLFSKKCKRWDPWQKSFATPGNFNRSPYESQDFIPTLNIFSISFELPTIDSAQKF